MAQGYPGVVWTGSVELDAICETYTAFPLHEIALCRIHPYREIQDGDLPHRKELNRFLCVEVANEAGVGGCGADPSGGKDMPYTSESA